MKKIHSSAWGLMLLSTALQIVIFPLPGVYWLSWIAVAPLLVALLRARAPETLQIDAGVHLLPASPWQAFLLAYICGILWHLGTCYWVFDTMHRYGGIAVPWALLILLAASMHEALYHGLFGLLVGVTAKGKGGVQRALVFAPFFWVAAELAKTRISAFPWELLGYAQTGNPALTRVATITGVYGLSFEIMLVNSAFAAAFVVAKERRKWLLIAAAGAAVILQAGQWLPLPAVATDKTALLVQSNIPAEANWTTDYFQGTLRDLTWISLHPPGPRSEGPDTPALPRTTPDMSDVYHGDFVRPVSERRKFDLIVWPESPSPFFLNDANFREPVATLARQSQSWLLVGSIGVDSASGSLAHKSEVYNSAALISPSGNLAGRYDKIHLVPFGEYVPFKSVLPFMDMLTQQVGDFARGRSWAPLTAAEQRLGVSICYESVFPNEVRQSVRQGANVLVNITNDGWYGESGAWKQHLQMTQMRAVENGRWELVTTNTGVTATVDPYGRIMASTRREMRTALAAPYALLSGTTFYTRYGDWFPFLCAIISLGAIGAGMLKRRSQ